MKRALPLAAAAFLLAGCASTQQVWDNPGASERDFYMAAGRCRAQAESLTFAPPVQRAGVYAGCMNGEGWFLVDAAR